MLFNVTKAYDSYVSSINEEILILDPNEIIVANTYAELYALVTQKEIYQPILQKHGNNLVKLQQVIEKLYDLLYYRHLTKTSQSIEEPLCYSATDHYRQNFAGIIIMVAGNLIIVVALLRMLTLKNKMQTFERKEN